MSDYSELEQRILRDDPHMAARKDLHILAKAAIMAADRIGHAEERPNDRLDIVVCLQLLSDLATNTKNPAQP